MGLWVGRTIWASFPGTRPWQAAEYARGLVLGLSLWFGLPAGAPAAQPLLPISKIVITNVWPKEINHSLIRAKIRLREGDPYSRTAVNEDIKTLYAAGFVAWEQLEYTPEGGVVVTYFIRGNPNITAIRFEGNKRFSSKKLLRKASLDLSGLPQLPTAPQSQQVPEYRPKTKLGSLIGQTVDYWKIDRFAKEIRSMYEKSGYPETEVQYDVPTDDVTGQCTVIFRIKEAPKTLVAEVFFEGARSFSQKKLRGVVKTKQRWPAPLSIFRSGKLKEDQLEDDRDLLADFYRRNGYIDFELQEVRRLPVASGRIALVWVLSEGKQYKVGAIRFKGVSLFSTNDILQRLKMKVGAVFSPVGLEEDLQAIRDFYGDRGYIGEGRAGSIRLIAHKQPNIQTGTMDLLYELEEGEQSIIEKVEIKGNVRTRDKVIRRELAVSPGEVFNMVKVRLSKQRLEGMNLFAKVDAEPEPTGMLNRRNLVVGVEEKRTGQFGLGAGFSSIDSLFGFVNYGEENFDLFKPPIFRGGGQKLRLHLQVGLVSQIYNLKFTEPWFLGRKLRLDTDLYHFNYDNVSVNDLYAETRTGFRVGLTRALGVEYLRGTLSYTLENVALTDVQPDAPILIQEEEGSYLASKVGLGLTYDTRRSSFNVFLPDKGQKTEISTEIAGGPFGADTDFYSLELRTGWYFKGLASKHILELSGRVGVVNNYGDSPNVHLLDRWFLGGLYSLRGYQYRDVGPKVGFDHEPYGGKTYWFASAEYSIPIIEMLRLAVFYDIGMVYPDAFKFDPGPYDTGMFNDNWGVGIRLNIPYLGPLRLDYGIPLTSDPYNGGGGRFQFSAGWTREF